LTGTRRSEDSSSFETAGKGDSCPTCGAVLIPIVYGLPGGDLFEQAERGEVELGGCLVVDTNPQFHCRGQVAHYWRRGAQGQLIAQVR
jgi:hypothetical protein